MSSAEQNRVPENLDQPIFRINHNTIDKRTLANSIVMIDY
jgi:hypothetical protein